MAETFRHFTVDQLGDGVWAVLHRTAPPAPDAWAVSNAGIVDLGDRTLVFDTLMSPDAARELRMAAEELTGRLPDVVVYSHAHNDHTWGGSVFPEATIVSSGQARAAMVADGHLEVADFREVVTDRLAFWADAASSDDPVVRHDAPFFLPYWNGVAAALPALDLRYPDVTFDDRLELHGRDWRVELVATDRAHAAGDTFLLVPDARVAFCGDLLFVGCSPFLGDGDIFGLRASLRALEVSGADRFVPGHGPVGGAAELGVLARYVGDVEQLGTAGLEDTPMPDPYRSWGFARFFAPNVAFRAGGGRQAEAAPGDQAG